MEDYALSIGFCVRDLDFSPIKGPEGNIEYLLHLRKCADGEAADGAIEPDDIVDKAFEALAK